MITRCYYTIAFALNEREGRIEREEGLVKDARLRILVHFRRPLCWLVLMMAYLSGWDLVVVWLTPGPALAWILCIVNRDASQSFLPLPYAVSLCLQAKWKCTDHMTIYVAQHIFSKYYMIKYVIVLYVWSRWTLMQSVLVHYSTDWSLGNHESELLSETHGECSTDCKLSPLQHCLYTTELSALSWLCIRQQVREWTGNCVWICELTHLHTDQFVKILECIVSH